jgi:hypothetical protein
MCSEVVIMALEWKVQGGKLFGVSRFSSTSLLRIYLSDIFYLCSISAARQLLKFFSIMLI